jgi:DNA-directed RNA polymerase specialized sigma24 family protein
VAFEAEKNVRTAQQPASGTAGASAGTRRQWTKDSGPQASGDHLRQADSAGEKSQTAPQRNPRPAEEQDLIERLEAEWPALAAGPVRLRLQAWSEEEPVLGGFATPQQLLRHLDSLRGQHRARDEILAALVRQARNDPLAARVVLQTLLPGLKTLARRILFEAGERDELWSALLAHCWERIRHYPLERRPERIAANTLLDTLKKTTRELKRERRDRDRFSNELPADHEASTRSDSDVEQLLQRAVAAAAISDEEAELILRTRVDGIDLNSLAGDVGIAYHTLNVRRLRAEKRLLLFLGHVRVTSRGRKGPVCSARVIGVGLTGSAGRGAVTDLQPRR